ncbi:hypothetical protein GT002_37090, partial [Streptomyces sp. SID4917]|nr:hypothetical protein [Streptomyces sp. SID4917]
MPSPPPPAALPASAVEADEERLQDLVVSRTAHLLGMEEVPARPGRGCVLSAPADRYDIAIVSALAEGALPGRIEEARSALGKLATGRGRLVVYGGPRFLGPELMKDTVYLHTEELAEILADVEGDLAVLALFVLELTEHPGRARCLLPRRAGHVDRVAARDDAAAAGPVPRRARRAAHGPRRPGPGRQV